MKLRRILLSILLLSAILAGIPSCKKAPPGYPVGDPEQTLFVYMPWSTDLTGFFERNLKDIEGAVAAGVLEGKNRAVVFFMTSVRDAEMFELVYDRGKCVRRTLRTYKDPAFTTVEGITSILEDVKRFAPAPSYSMTVSCHGLGWVPIEAMSSLSADRPKGHWEYGEEEGKYLTRWFGGKTNDCRTNIATFAEGIAGAGIKMEYILFDDCYMSCVEVAYDLREVTDYVIACPTEIMAFGMPYAVIARHLVGDIDYRAICEDFIGFYSNPDNLQDVKRLCGTIGITDCSEMDELAAIMKEINSRFTFDQSLVGSVQTMCGYYPPLFFDCGSYVEKLCKDETLLQRFMDQLERTIPYKGHTENYYSGGRGEVYIGTFSGTTISDPSYNQWASGKATTAWYKATH